MSLLLEEILAIELELSKNAKKVNYLKSLEFRKIKNEEELLELEDIVRKETDDVTKLQNLSVGKLFLTYLGSYETKIEKEKEELLEAILNYKDCLKQKELIEFEIEILNKSIQNEKLLKEKLEFYLNARSKEIKNTDKKIGIKLHMLEHKIILKEVLLKEQEEAFEGGRESNEQLTAILENLTYLELKVQESDDPDMPIMTSNSRKKWGNIIKEQANNAKKNIQYFIIEMKDVNPDYGLLYYAAFNNIESFVKSMNKNMIKDYVSRSALKYSIIGVSETIENLNLTIMELKHKLNKTKDELELIKNERSGIIKNQYGEA